MRKTIVSLASVIALTAASVSAQNGINSTVEVERDYEGRIARAVKSRIDPPVDDSLLNFKLNFDYADFYNPYKDLYEFSPIMTVGPASAGRVAARGRGVRPGLRRTSRKAGAGDALPLAGGVAPPVADGSRGRGPGAGQGLARHRTGEGARHAVARNTRKTPKKRGPARRCRDLFVRNSDYFRIFASNKS